MSTVARIAMPRRRVREIPIHALPPERFNEVLDDEAVAALLDVRERGHEMLSGRAVWCVNSTANGGGVAEMLRSLLAYTRGAGVDARWGVIDGTPDFFTLTKRLHNRLHGAAGDGGPLGPDEHVLYDAILAHASAQLAPRIQPGDIVILHDPQTAGMSGAMRARGAHVVWRAHIGTDDPNDFAREAWDFLRPKVAAADAFVFSREDFVWSGLGDRPVSIIPPSIDAFSAKNQDLSPGSVRAILAAAGIVDDDAPGGEPVFAREDGTPGRVERPAQIVESRRLRPEDRIVTQVSRWDHLKDPVGVLQGFADCTGACTGAHLVLAGPIVHAVSDDPEGAQVLAEVVAAWNALPADVRARIHLVTLDMTDPEENAAVVNALQNRAEVVVQKSLAEGFGLTVAEAMWKGRPLVASAVGGIRDQLVDGVNGLLLEDPADLGAYAAAICRLLDDPALAQRLGTAARLRVRAEFLEPRSLGQWLSVMGALVASENGARRAVSPASVAT